MIYNFPELGKTKPVNSKTRFVTLKLQNIWSDFYPLYPSLWANCVACKPRLPI